MRGAKAHAERRLHFKSSCTAFAVLLAKSDPASLSCTELVGLDASSRAQIRQKERAQNAT